MRACSNRCFACLTGTLVMLAIGSLGTGLAWAGHDLNLTWSTTSPLTTRLSATLRACPARGVCTGAGTILATIEGTSPLRFHDDDTDLPKDAIVRLEVRVPPAGDQSFGPTAGTGQGFRIEGTVKTPTRTT